MNPFQYLKNRKLRKRHKELRVSLRDILAADDDILSSAEKEKLRTLQAEVLEVSPVSEGAENRIAGLETKYVALTHRNTFFYTMRGFMDVFAVALTVAFGIRALFLQPFKIPTSSMQPTLFGIHYVDKKESEPFLGPVTTLFLPWSSSRAIVTTETGGEFREGSEPFSRSLIPVTLQLLFQPSESYLSASRILVGSEWHTLPGSDVYNTIYRYLDEPPVKQQIPPGKTVFDGYLFSGDHLFVDRLSIHFKPLERGEIFIFTTNGLRTMRGIPLTGYYYVKRVAGMPGDTLKIVDNALYVKPEGAADFSRVDELSPRFKRHYSGKGGYQGHKAWGLLAEGREFKVPPASYFALGDNTNNSLDSREWNVVPHENVIGRAFFLFWPVSRRWGAIDTLDPLPVDTVIPPKTTQPTAMRLQ